MVGPDAHAVAVDWATHKSYFPLKNVRGHTVLRIMSPLPATRPADPVTKLQPVSRSASYSTSTSP